MECRDLLDRSPFDIDRHVDLWVEWPSGAGGNRSRSEKPQDFDVFISYNDDDWAEVKEVVERLRQTGIRCWVARWDLRPGTSWLDAVEKVFNQTSSMLALVGQNTSDFQISEIEAFVQRFPNQQRPLIPVILQSVAGEPRLLLPSFLQRLGFVDLRKTDPDPFEQLVYGITGRKPDRRRA